MLPLFETFLELLMWNRCQCRRHMFRCQHPEIVVPLEAEFICGNSQKSIGAKSVKQGGRSISVTNCWARNCWTKSPLRAGAQAAGESNRAKIQAFSLFV